MTMKKQDYITIPSMLCYAMLCYAYPYGLPMPMPMDVHVHIAYGIHEIRRLIKVRVRVRSFVRSFVSLFVRGSVASESENV